MPPPPGYGKKDDFDPSNVNPWRINPTGQGNFGFGWNAELQNGRAAMIAMAAWFIKEITTGESLWEQVGMENRLVQIIVFGIALTASFAIGLGYFVIKNTERMDRMSGKLEDDYKEL